MAINSEWRRLEKFTKCYTNVLCLLGMAELHFVLLIYLRKSVLSVYSWDIIMKKIVRCYTIMYNTMRI